MENDLHNIIRELSEIYDKNSSDTFLTLYIKKDSLDNKFLKRREKACKSLLSGSEQKNFESTMEEIRDYLKKNKSDNYAIFASNKYNFLKSVKSPVEIENSLIVDSSPYIRPLARVLDEWESFTLILISSNYAKIYSLSYGKIDFEKNLSKDIMNKHKKGGCSQARFQRLRKGAINKFFNEVLEALEKIADKRIILAGPGTAKIQFKDKLPKYIDERIVDIIDVNVDDEKNLLKESIRLISENEKEKSRNAVKQLKAEILRDGLATYGIDETLKAVKNGQVELLIVEKDYKIKGWICEHCQIVKHGSVQRCPYCNDIISEVDIIEEILEFAARTEADIEFTDDEEIAYLGHIGAILRYR